jgi:hypothetical protein
MAMRYPLHPETIETISQAQVPVQLPYHRQLEISLEVAEQAMELAHAADLGDMWYRAWKRVEEVRGLIKRYG